MFNVTHYLAQARQPFHYDAQSRISVVLSGGLVEETADRSVVAGPLDLVVKSHRVLHECQFSDLRTSIMSFSIDPSVLYGKPEDTGSVEWRWLQHSQGFGLAIDLLEAARVKDQTALDNTQIEIVALAAGNAAHKVRHYGSSVQLVRERIYDCPDQVVDVKMTAAEIGLHPVSLARAYRKAFGVSIQDDRQLRRIRLASCMLTHGDCRASDIAQALGFFDQSHFCRLFKRYTGKSPVQYRRQILAFMNA